MYISNCVRVLQNQRICDMKKRIYNVLLQPVSCMQLSVGWVATSSQNIFSTAVTSIVLLRCVGLLTDTGRSFATT